jgi:Zn-dependent metalloprotease
MAQDARDANRGAVDEAVKRLAATGRDVRMSRSKASGLLRFIAARRGRGFATSAPKGATAEQRAHAFIAGHGTAFGLGRQPETKLLRVTPRDRVGLKHVRVQQTYRGIPVTGAEVIVHLDGDNVRAANGHTLDIADIGDLDVSPAVSEASAQDIAAAVVRETYGVAETKLAAPRLEVFNRGIFDDSDAPSRLAWFVAARAPRVLEYVWVDAHDGSVLLHFNQVSHALNREIYDMQSGTPVLVRSEGGAPVGDADTDNLYDYWKITYDFYQARFGRDSIDGAGQKLIAAVHDAGAENALWNPMSESFAFADGWVVDDVVAHEYTHGVVFHTAALFDFMECGSLNESFSDILGETVDLTDGVGNDGPEVRWLNAEEVVGIGPTRNAMNPNQFGQPGRISDPMYSCGRDDYYGEHHNSSVSSHAYALMVDGGTYNGHTIRGIGLDKAVQVAYRALITYVTSASGFADASDAFQQACTDLVGSEFGIIADDCAQVQQALEAVEMPDARPCHSILVRIRTAGAGSGQVTFLRNGRESIPCDPLEACDQYVYEGTFQQVDATPDPGSVFAGWRGACTDAANPCVIRSISGDTLDVVAVFEPVGTTHTVTVAISAAAPGATVTSSSGGINCGSGGSVCTAVFDAGEVVTLSATADPGYGLVRWSGDCSGIGATCAFSVSGAKFVEASFGPMPFSPVQDLGGTSGVGGSAAWGDYDGDGDVDLVVITAGSSAVSTLYRNDGGVLVDSGTPLVALRWNDSVAWGDYDNDGDLDLAVPGADSAANPVLYIYRNDGGVLVDSGMAWPSIDGVARLAWIDYDNDGRLDLACRNGSGNSWILRNDRGTLVDSGVALPAAWDWQWGDYDGDGRLDLVAVHESIDDTNFKSTLYRNDGGTLVDTGTFLDAPNALAAAWVDYDNDGHLDLSFDSGELFHNQGGKLVKVASPLKPGPNGSSIAWADADANGYSDLLVFEAERSYTALFLNQSGGSFSEVAPGDQPLGYMSMAAWADSDNDGRLELFVHPEHVLYHSSLGAPNTAPLPPTSTSVLLSADGARLMWQPGSDAQTPSTGLSYNVRVGTTPNGSEIVSAMSDATTGRRLLPQVGNAGLNEFFILKGLAPGTYYWAVQSIDTSFSGSPFTAAGSFNYPPAVSASVNITSDWGTGYCADLTVTNISSTTANGWETGFALPGGSAAAITSLTNFQYTRDGAVVMLTPRWFNRTLTAGQSARGRVCANGSTGAEYELQVYTNGLGWGYVSASPVGIECGLDCSESYPGGTVVTLTATPAFGSTFLRWEGACSGSAPTCTVTMGIGGAAVTAWFMRGTPSYCTPNFTVAPLPNTQTGNFNSTSEVCFLVQSAQPLYFNCSQMFSRTVTVNGTLYPSSACDSSAAKKVKLAVAADGKYYFDVSAGNPSWSSIAFWNEN